MARSNLSACSTSLYIAILEHTNTATVIPSSSFFTGRLKRHGPFVAFYLYSKIMFYGKIIPIIA